MAIDAETFARWFGMEPDIDDLSRVNCSEVGQDGHKNCGVCLVCRCPGPLCCDHNPPYVPIEEAERLWRWWEVPDGL